MPDVTFRIPSPFYWDDGNIRRQSELHWLSQQLEAVRVFDKTLNGELVAKPKRGVENLFAARYSSLNLFALVAK